jgi:DNA-binding NtrC family response regulator
MLPDSQAADRDASRLVSVLVVDDEESFHEIVRRNMPASDYRLISVYAGWQALEALARHHVDVCLLDIKLNDVKGEKLLPQLLAEWPDLEVVIITSHAEYRLAVECTKAGAFDFLTKSTENFETLAAHIDRAIEHRRTKRAEQAQRADDAHAASVAQMESSKSPAMLQLVDLLRKVAPTPLPLLLQGESGVGKEALARFVHRQSRRPRGAFVAVNVAAIAPAMIESTLFGHEKGAFTGADRQRIGKFELADRGTLFLDEIADLDPTHQATLLRVLQEREVERLGAAEPSPVDVRLNGAAHKDLETEVAEGRFREDL